MILSLLRSRFVAYGVLAVAVLALSAYAFFKLWRAADERADAAVDALASERANVRIVTRVVEVQKEVIRRVPVIQRELVRLCDDASRPAPGTPDAAAEAEARDVSARRLQALGSEIADSLQELEAFVGLQKVAANLGCPK